MYALLFYKKDFRTVLQKMLPVVLRQRGNGNLRICKFMKSISMAQKCRRRYAVYKEKRVYARTERMDCMSGLLRVENLVKYYGNRSSLTKALNDISLNVEEGEFTAIMGASGSGKTTLLNCISTIDRPTAGHIYIDGVCTSKLKRNALADFRRDQLGFIFQEFNLLDTLTVCDNIAIALQIQKCAPKEVRGRVREAAEKLGIEDVLDKYPYQISGGQKQRTAAARGNCYTPFSDSCRRAYRSAGFQKRAAASGQSGKAEPGGKRSHSDGNPRRIYSQLFIKSSVYQRRQTFP